MREYLVVYIMYFNISINNVASIMYVHIHTCTMHACTKLEPASQSKMNITNEKRSKLLIYLWTGCPVRASCLYEKPEFGSIYDSGTFLEKKLLYGKSENWELN